ncbi:hypothetical protein EJB05_27136, partial [Eragrostis curvula]
MEAGSQAGAARAREWRAHARDTASESFGEAAGGAEASKPSRRPLGSASAIVFHGLSARSASARSNEPSRQSARPPSPHRRWPLHILPRAAAARRWPEVERWSM